MMRIAITATGMDLESAVDPRFGRCPYFLVVESDDLRFEAVENPNAALGGGAGIQSAQLVAAKGVTHVLTGNCGPNAHQTLSAAGIGIVVGCSGAVRDVIEQYRSGQFAATGAPNVASHFGMGADSPDGSSASLGASPASGQGMGGGRGMGGGQGMGGGRGMGGGQGMGGGRGMGGGQGMGGGRGMGGGGGSPAGQVAPIAPVGDELSALKQEADAMGQQMQQIQQRIQEVGRQTRRGVQIDQEKCTGCGVCIEVCPVDAISLVESKARLDAETCIECGLCQSQCPTEAIRLEQ